MDRSPALLSEDDLHRFARQLILSGFEEDHQLALLESHVAVIGAGGLGSPLLQYLVAAGIGKITIFDDDQVEATNLNRQVLHTHHDLGRAKTTSAAEKAIALNPSCEIITRAERFDKRIINDDEFSIICDASDNAQTRYAANTWAHHNKIPLIFGGAVRLEGQVAVFRSGIENDAPCFQCVFPQQANANLAPGCSEAGILGAITGIIGSIMALEAIRHCLKNKYISNPLGEGLKDHLLLLDGRTMDMDKIKIKKSHNCSCCGS